MSDPTLVPPAGAPPQVDLDQLVANVKENNGEFTTAIALLVAVSQKIAAKLNDNELTDSVNAVKAFVKGTHIAGRTPPGCVLPGFDNLPPDLQGILGAGWKQFFDQQP